MSTKPLKTIIVIITCVYSLLCVFFWTRRDPVSAATPREKSPPAPQIQATAPRLKRIAPQQDSLTAFQKTEFYRTIVDYNLFRPLGWRPPRPREPYRLIGTLIPRDGATPKQAIVQRMTTGGTETVTIGETLDAETKVVDIASKQVTLETGGRQRTLKLH